MRQIRETPLRQRAAFLFRGSSHIDSDMAQDDPLGEAGGEGARAGDMPKVDWDKIKHAYIHGDWSLGRIADAPT